MRGASIGILLILTVIGVVISGCTEKQAEVTEKTSVTATATPAQVAASDSKIPAWLGISKDWRDRVVGKLNLPAEGAGLKRTAGGDDKYDDNEIVVGDGVPELAAGIQGDNIALVVDRDFFEKYDGEVQTNFVYSGGAQGISMKEFTDLGNGLYYVIVPIGGKDDMGFSGGGSPKTREEAKQIPQLEFEKK